MVTVTDQEFYNFYREKGGRCADFKEAFPRSFPTYSYKDIGLLEANYRRIETRKEIEAFNQFERAVALSL